jgi:hypothetical protein
MPMLGGESNATETAKAGLLAQQDPPSGPSFTLGQPGPAPEHEPAESEKTTADLVETLAKFIKIKAGNVPEPKPDSGIHLKQGLTLFFLVLNVTLLYVLVNAWLPKVVNTPVWHLLGQVIPIALGSAYLLRGSKQLQSYLLDKAAHTGFLVLMLLGFIVIGTIASLTQVPHFSLGIEGDSSPGAEVISFCVQPVDNLRDAKLLAVVTETPSSAGAGSAADKSSTQTMQSCPGGDLYLGSDSGIHSLRLAQDYRITVKYVRFGNQSFYLGAGAIWNRYFGREAEKLNFSLGKLIIPPASSGKSKKLTIIRQGAISLVHLPAYDVKNCYSDDKDTTVTTCYLYAADKTFMHLVPATYSFKLDNCQIKDLTITTKDENLPIPAACN